MAWTIRYLPEATKALEKMDKSTAKRILTYLTQVAELDDPRSRGKALTGNLAGLWRYRVGDWHVVTQIRDDELLIITTRIAHRSRVY